MSSASDDRDRDDALPPPRLALAMVGSNLTAIAAELVAASGRYDRVLAIPRRGAKTSLPTAFDGHEWAERFRQEGAFRLIGRIREFDERLSGFLQGERFDALLIHSSDPLSQLLSSHPLCARFYYLDEGFTALTGDKFGRPRKRPRQKALWALKSALLYRNRINRYRVFFDRQAPNYGGAYALSKASFKDFPGRVQLSLNDLPATAAAPGDVVVFLDSQYFIGNCEPADYLRAVTDCLSRVVTRPSTVAVKFHPAERDDDRREKMKQAIRELPHVTAVVELPAGFIGERMAFDPDQIVIVGTSALGLYLGDRGFRTYTFALRLVDASPRYAAVVREIPPQFLEVCRSDW